MRAFVCATLAAIAFADASDFPADDAMHADCHLSASFPQISCDSLYALVEYEVQNWTVALSPAGGAYSLYEDESDVYIWSKRTTRDGKYVDDQLFEFA